MQKQKTNNRVHLLDTVLRQLFLLIVWTACLTTAPLQVQAQTAKPSVADPPEIASRYIDPVHGLGVEALIRLALQANTDLMATRQQTVEAQGYRRQAALITNPGLDFSFTNGSLLGSQGERDLSVGLAHTFELGGKRGRRIAMAQSGVEQSRQSVRDRERLLRAEITTWYGEALATARNLSVTEELYQITKQSYEMNAAQVRGGETSQLDFGLLHVEFKRLEADRLLFEHQVERALLMVKQLIGMPLEDALRLSDVRPKLPLTVTLDRALARATDLRPDLRALRLDAEREAAAVLLARANGVPDLIGSLRFSRSTARFDQLGLTPAGTPTPLIDTDKVLTAGVSFTLPFFNRNQGGRDAAQARSDAAHYRKQYAEQVVRQEVRAAYSRYRAAGQALTLFDNEVMGQARNNLDILREAYRLGEVRLLDVIAEQRRLIETQHAYTNVLKEYYQARADMERAIGEPFE